MAKVAPQIQRRPHETASNNEIGKTDRENMMFNFKFKKTNRTTKSTTRVIKTKRWIHRDELKVGMYVSELDVAWEDTNFMFQGFVVDNMKLLKDICAISEKT